jgi:hypothetical protein
MNQHFQRRARPTDVQRQPQQREEQRQQRDAKTGELTLDQHAGAVARGIIQHVDNVPDTTPIWRALKEAYLAGYDEASR